LDIEAGFHCPSSRRTDSLRQRFVDGGRNHWRKRLGGKLKLLLAESLRVAHESGALRTKDLARVTVDITVQPKDITFPTDAKLLHAAIKWLTRLARKRGVRLRQSFVHIAKRAAMMAARISRRRPRVADDGQKRELGGVMIAHYRRPCTH